jgi:hypothetical protein
MSVLSHLVGDPGVLIANWEETPFVSTGLPDLDAVFSLETVEQLIGSGTLPLACVRMIHEGVTLPSQRLGRRAERKQAAQERVVDGAAVAREVVAGATLIVEDLQTYSPEVAAFAGALAAETGYCTYCAAFVTPGDARGSAPHYDQMSVFIRQVHGSKRWRVTRPVQRWPGRAWSADQDVETDVVLEAELEAGDCLYIPRGYIHSGTASARASAHLSIGLIPPTWAAILRRLTDSALGAESMREALPYGFHTMDQALLLTLLTDRVAAFTTALAGLARSADADLALAKVRPRAAQLPPAAGSLRSALTAAGQMREITLL